MSGDVPDHSIGWNVIFSTRGEGAWRRIYIVHHEPFCAFCPVFPAQSSPCPTSPKLEKKRVETSRQKSVFSRSLVAQ